MAPSTPWASLHVRAKSKAGCRGAAEECHDVKLTGKRRDPAACKLHSFASICRTVCYSACFLSNEELHENSENFMPCRQLGQTPTGLGIVYLNFPQHLEGRNASEVLSALETAGLKAT